MRSLMLDGAKHETWPPSSTRRRQAPRAADAAERLAVELARLELAEG